MSEFTYELPFSEETLLKGIADQLKREGKPEWAAAVLECEISLSEGGYSFYEGRGGRTRWNAYGIIVKLRTAQHHYSTLAHIPEKRLVDICNKLIPDEVGYDVKKVEYVPALQDEQTAPAVKLPSKSEETLQTLIKDISLALNRNEPTLVLDRLHTYSTKLLRQICDQNGISTTNNKGEYLPLHSIAGALKKHYESTGILQSEFSALAIKSSISLFDAYNKIRNDQSYAHDNNILNTNEASFVVRIMADLISFIDTLESQRGT